MKQRTMTRKRQLAEEQRLARENELARLANLGGAQYGDHQPLRWKPFERLRIRF